MVNDCLLRNNGSGSAPITMFMFAYVHRYSRKTNIWDKLLRSTKTEGGACDRIDDLCELNVWTFSTECIHWRKQELERQISSSNPQVMSPVEKDKLLTTFKEYHDTISITEGDR